MQWQTHLLRIFVWAFVITLTLATIWIVQNTRAGEPAETPTSTNTNSRCEGPKANDFQCFKNRFTHLTEALGPKVALANLKKEYANNPFVYSQCHQLVHVIGNVVAERIPDIADAFIDGDAICWSGYYHGVVERYAQIKGRDKFISEADTLCAKISDKTRYGFDYYNCVHGLGHGVMAITRNNLFDALSLCKNLTGDWEKHSCYGGVFMENVMVDNRGHGEAELKPDDLLYPCTVVENEFKEECYKMQTSYALTKNGYDFRKLFELCAVADVNYRRTCAQSIGRDASGQSVSDVKQTIGSCSLGRDDDQITNCYIGAAKDFVAYHHSDVQARTLCDTIPPFFKMACETALLQQWSTVKPIQ